MITYETEYLPSFGLGFGYQAPVCIYTVLSINEQVGDCAAYRGVGPTDITEELIETIRAGGDKISETDARKLFGEIESLKLRYRK